MITFDFFNYSKNPIADYCISKNKDIKVYTLEDMMPYIEKLPHSKRCLDLGINISIGNQLRLYLATQEDDFLYVDADVFLPETSISEIKKYKNCIYYNKKFDKIENGTFFHSDKDCKFNKFYLERYNELGEEEHFRRINVFRTFPYDKNLNTMTSGDMKLIKPEIRHFFISNFYKFKQRNPNIDKIVYTYNKVTADMGGVFWVLEDNLEEVYNLKSKNNSVYFFNTVTPLLPKEELFNLWKEQINYVYQKEMQFEEV